MDLYIGSKIKSIIIIILLILLVGMVFFPAETTRLVGYAIANVKPISIKLLKIVKNILALIIK